MSWFIHFFQKEGFRTRVTKVVIIRKVGYKWERDRGIENKGGSPNNAKCFQELQLNASQIKTKFYSFGKEHDLERALALLNKTVFRISIQNQLNTITSIWWRRKDFIRSNSQNANVTQRHSWPVYAKGGKSLKISLENADKDQRTVGWRKQPKS